MINSKQFNAWKEEGYNFVPLILEILGDLDTPLSLYLKVANTPYTYLLESGFNGENWGRYSFIGLECHTRILVKNHQVTHITDNNPNLTFQTDNPLDYIQSVFESFKVPKMESISRFYGGFVGYFGYDTIRYIEPRLDQFNKNDPLNVPDIYLMLSDQLLVFDNLSGKIYIVVYADPTHADAYDRALHKIEKIKQLIGQSSVSIPPLSTATGNDFHSNISEEKYEACVKKASDYFKAGDAMQLILSQRFSREFKEPPIHLYRTIRHLNPSPYMYYMNLSEFHIVGASPEILVRLEEGELTVRPLAGTRPRGRTLKEDKQFERELLADAKEISEHLMLIDLGRNDIGKVSEVGTVKVTEQMVVERYSHVMHISSTVQGTLKPNLTMLDVLKATFPAGTVSGAPKVRAMEIIDELEEDQRGIYGGAVGYLGWSGNMDLALALRTAVIKQNTIFIQAGAGLVADSVPKNEWQECINKGRALFAATTLTEQNYLELNHDPND